MDFGRYLGDIDLQPGSLVVFLLYIAIPGGRTARRPLLLLLLLLLLLKIKSVGYSSQGTNTGQLDRWQMAARRHNVISITLRQV